MQLVHSFRAAGIGQGVAVRADEKGQVLSCRLRSLPLPLPFRKYCGSFVPEDEPERLIGKEVPIGPVWVRIWDAQLPSILFPFGPDYPEDPAEGYRLVPVLDWQGYLDVLERKDRDAMREFLLRQTRAYGEEWP